MRIRILILVCLLVPGFKSTAAKTVFSKDAKTKILLIGTPLDVPSNKTGYLHHFGTHMYMDGCRLLAKCLKQSDGVEAVVSVGWPDDEELLDQVDAIVLYSTPGAEILLKGPQATRFEAMMKDGVGLSAIHWGTGVADPYDKELEEKFLNYLGGIFSHAYSRLEMLHTPNEQLVPAHAICAGWCSNQVLDEIYVKVKVLPEAKPIQRADVSKGEQVIAWTYERPNSNGGRSFGNTLGHFHENFWITSFRKALINGILWTAHYDLPESGAPCMLEPSDLDLTDHLHLYDPLPSHLEVIPVPDRKAFSNTANKKIVLIGTADEPIHMKQCRILAKCLEQSAGVEAVVSEGWPEDRMLLDKVDAIALCASPGAELLLKSTCADQFEALMNKGVGLSAIHLSAGIQESNDKELEEKYLHYLGGVYHIGSESRIVQTLNNQLAPEHAISAGWCSYEMYDKFYPGVKILPDALPLQSYEVKGIDKVIAWAYERPDSRGGRSFGNALGHFHDNFWITSFRRTLLNGILWTAHYDIPETGAPCMVWPSDVSVHGAAHNEAKWLEGVHGYFDRIQNKNQ